jgi:hypothetical protein
MRQGGLLVNSGPAPVGAALSLMQLPLYEASTDA